MTALAGAVTLVTGATSGIGRSLVERLVASGATVVAAGRGTEALAKVAAETGAHSLAADLGQPSEVRRLARDASAIHGRVDVLVNAAGRGWAGAFVSMDPEVADRLVAVNLNAPIHLARLLVPGMVARGRGHVVNVASIAGAVGVRSEAVYAATKAGLLIFSDSLRGELAGSPVSVTSVLPGAVDTGFFERRGLPYARTWPRPIRPTRVAEATVRAIERDRAEVYVPGWMQVPARLQGAAPALYRWLARHLE